MSAKISMMMSAGLFRSSTVLLFSKTRSFRCVIGFADHFPLSRPAVNYLRLAFGCQLSSSTFFTTSHDGSGKTESSHQQAELYNKLVSRQIPSDLSILNRLTLKEGSKVLDLGCGTGNVTSVLVEAVGPKCQVIGVDPDQERIDIANKSNAHPNVNYLIGDGENFPEDQYDLVFCNYIMPVIKDKESVFRKVSQNLHPNGGVFLLLTPTTQPVPTKEISCLMGPEGEAVISQFFHFESSSVYQSYAKASGLKVLFKEEGVDYYIHPNTESALNAWMGITHGMFDPSKANPEALQRFREKYNGQEMKWPIPVVRYLFAIK